MCVVNDKVFNNKAAGNTIINNTMVDNVVVNNAAAYNAVADNVVNNTVVADGGLEDRKDCSMCFKYDKKFVDTDNDVDDHKQFLECQLFEGINTKKLYLGSHTGHPTDKH